MHNVHVMHNTRVRYNIMCTPVTRTCIYNIIIIKQERPEEHEQTTRRGYRTTAGSLYRGYVLVRDKRAYNYEIHSML